MSSGGTIQFRQSRTPHVEEPFARKLKTRSSLTPAPESGLSSQPSNARDTEPQDVEGVLKNFDLTSKYGPCLGLTRLQRWKRAEQLGLEPPAEVHEILHDLPSDDGMHANIWAGRV